MLIFLNILLLATPLFAQAQIPETTSMTPTLYQNNMPLSTNKYFPLEPPQTVSVSVGIAPFSGEKIKDTNTEALPIVKTKNPVTYKTPTTSIQDFSTNYQIIEEFFHFIRIGDIDSVTKYLDEGISPNIRKLPDLTNGMTALMCSIANRRVLITQLLLSYKADPNLSLNKSTISNISPLMLAAQQGPIETIDYLLDYGSDIDARTTGEITGNTALMVAIQSKRYDTVELLLDRGANINNASGRGITPLMLAAQTGDIDIVNLLVSNPRTDIDTVDKEGKNALVYGYISGNKELIQLFIQLEMTTDLSPEEIRAITKKYL